MKFYVAPMMDYTDRHFRTLLRLITRKSALFTEMVVCSTLIHGKNTAIALDADMDLEEPVILQLGGCDPGQMEKSSAIAKRWGYNKFNINVGCPSTKVAGAGAFGAVLMKDPHLVADLCTAICNATGTPPSVKCRIGVDDMDSYEHLSHFIDTVSRKGNVGHFLVHARKAVLGKSFTPHDNRTIPPLRYDYVYRLIKDFPDLEFTLNGGVVSFEDIEQHAAQGVSGVMVGRGIIQDPFMYRNVDRVLYGDYTKHDVMTRRDILRCYAVYAQRIEDERGKKSRSFLLKALHNLFHGEHNGKAFRRSIDAFFVGRGPEWESLSLGEAILKCGDVISDDVLDSY